MFGQHDSTGGVRVWFTRGRVVGAPSARRGAWVVSARRCGGGGSTVDVRGQRRAASQVVRACVERVALANRAMRAPLARSALADLVVRVSIGVDRFWAWSGVDAERFVGLRVLLARRFASASDRKAIEFAAVLS